MDYSRCPYCQMDTILNGKCFNCDPNGMPVPDVIDQDDPDHPLDRVEGFLRRFVAFPSEAAAVAASLWVAHTHVIDVFETTPRLAVLSPEPGSGKSRVLEVLDLLCPGAVQTFNTSVAVLFRSMTPDEDRPGPVTMLIDEADTIFGPRASKDHEDLRGFVNAGYRRGAVARRCETRGKSIVIVDFPAFAPVAIAGLDDLPDTIMTRAVVIRMRKRAPHERVEPFRPRMHRPQGHDLRDAVAEWVQPYADHLAEAWPTMPPGVEDRAADIWEPLIAIADVAGGDWPERARAAAVDLVTESRSTSESLGVRLLRDVRHVFRDAVVMSTADLIAGLVAIEDSPWPDLRGKPIDARGLSRRLARYQVHPMTVRVGTGTAKGYRREDLHDAWTRYIPDAVTDVTDVTDPAGGGEGT